LKAGAGGLRSTLPPLRPAYESPEPYGADVLDMILRASKTIAETERFPPPTPAGHSRGGTCLFAARPASISVLVAVFAFTVCYFRLFIFPNVPVIPLGDQIDFANDASRILAGQLPYRDFFEIVPPGADLTYALLIKVLGLHTWLPGFVMCSLAAATVVVMTLAARRLMSGANLALPGLFFTGFILLESLDATHHWFSTLTAIVAMLVLLDGITLSRVAAVGALCGITASFTQTKGATVVAGFVAYLIWKMHRQVMPAGECWRKCLLLCGMAAAVFSAGNAYFVRAAGLREWFFCVVVYPLRYYSSPVINNWRILGHEFWWSQGVSRWIAFPFVYATVPFLYIIFVLVMLRRSRDEPGKPWDLLFLVALTGFAMFLAVASSPSIKRLSSVSPPAMILLAWLVSMPGKTTNRLKTALGALAVAAAIAAPVLAQTQWHATLDFPGGRTAFRDPGQAEEYRWALKHTHPGQFFFGMSPLYIPLRLQNPAAIVGFDPSDYTRPEQVLALIHAIESHFVPMMILPSSRKYPLLTGAPSDHLRPFWEYLRRNYRRTRTFKDGDEVWERID
jgi:hypothetical protein